MELDETKKNTVETVISSIAGGIAYCHFVEYNFKKSLEEPNLKPVNYRIFAPKLYENAKQLWVEGLASLKEYDISLSANLFGKNFTEELYFSGDKRISLHIKGRVVSSITSSKTMEIVVTKSLTPSNYEYYDIEFKVLTPVRATYTLVTKTGNVCGVHKKFMDDVKHDLGIMSSVLNFGKKDFVDFDNEVTRSFAKFPDLQSSKDAIKMAILFTWPTTYNPQKSYVALIPPAFEIPQNNGKKQITAGGVALFTNNYLSLSPLLFDCLQNWVSIHTTKQLVDYSRNEAIKSAKAAIMSRNMSHNLGSHVMSYLKQHLSSVTNIINDNVLAEMITSASDTTLIPSDKPLPFLVGMGHFLSYLQERQDFIATIATDYIPYFSTVNFKDFVYDELNPDKRFERHKDRKNLQPDNIMLGNIARSEGLGRKIQTTSRRTGLLSDIVLNFRDAEGHIFDGEPVVNSSNGIISGRNDASKALEAMRKLEVSLPGGVIGRQAIFSIVENIIRNAAKHGNWRRQGKLELTFDFVDKDAIEEYGQLIRRKIELEGLKREGTLTESEQSEYDSIINELEKKNSDAAPIETPSYLWPWRKKHLSLMEVLWLFYSQSLDADELYFVSITDNIVISDSAVNKLREAILEPYIDNDSKMKEANKGIKEIRISAAWLRGAKNEEEYFTDPTDDKNPQTEKKAPLVYVRQHNGCLQYIFCLQKPRNVAVVTQDPLSTTAIKALKEVNWRYYSPEEYMKERNKSYVFTICENQDVFNIIRPFSSSRVYIPDSKNLWNSIKNGLSESDSKVYEKELYQSLVKEKSTIWIDDDKAKGGMTTYIREDADYATQEDAGYYKVNDVDVCVIDGCQSHVDYIYRKHHDTLEQFTTFMGVNPNGCQFVESITGDTSTDRLVRNEKYDFRWYYSHLHAMQKKVAIFDERLFSRIYGLEEADFTKGSVEDLDELKTRYCEIKPLSRRRINDCKTFDDLKRIVSDMNLPSIEVSRSDVYTKDYIALTYFQKGVCFYTLIKDSAEDSSTKTFGVYGLYYEGVNSLMPQCDEKYSCRCERIATLSWQNQTLKVEFEKSSKKQTENQFDFISIHQGLLDKLYEAFDIKSNQEEKIQFTTTLCRRFSKISSDNSRDWKSGFIPGLVIHSGRSKPAENDMPQMLPFIQYASIEHAVLDCKYSLVDLLENARYER